jgi:hypothetical protein
MASEDNALKGTENASTIWKLLYLVAAFGFIFRLSNLWFAFHAQPFSWKKPVDLGFEILALPLPLWMGVGCRRMLNSELDKGMLSDRTYRICDYWIAHLLVSAYICLVLIRS